MVKGARLLGAIALQSLAGTFGDLPARAEVRPEELALVRALQAGSEEAFAQLVAQYSGSLYSFIARSLPNPADAADITQDVFIKIFRSIGKFNGHSSLRTWIYRIAVHEASNGRRWWSRHKRAEVTIDAEIPGGGDEGAPMLRDTLADRRESPCDAAMHAELRATVDEALRALPDLFRTVVVLREMEGMAYDEIAEILELQMGTVKSRLMRGRALLRKELSERMPEFGTRMVTAQEGKR